MIPVFTHRSSPSSKNFSRERGIIFSSMLFAFLLSFTGGIFAQENLDVRHYQATLRFNIAESNLIGDANLTIANTTGKQITTMTLKLRDLTVDRCEQNSQPITFTHTGEDVTLNLTSPIVVNQETGVRIFYHGKATDEGGSAAWGGFFWGNPTFSMGVGFAAPYVSMMRHWIPSNDIPSDKATFDLTYIVPKTYAAAGTGILQSITPLGIDSLAYRWIENHQTATYLVTVAVGKYSRVQSSWKGIPCEYFVMQKDSAKASVFFSTLSGMMDCFTNAFGPYPFDKIGYCMTPIGAMEHQTMISYPQQLFDFYTRAEAVAAHELSHQWWGDWVTPKDFREAWLSEGFATFSEALYAEFTQPGRGYWTTIKKDMSDYINTTAKREGIFPLYDFPRTPPSSNYPTTIYEKGSAVLAMLRYTVGDSAFFRGLRKHGQRFAYGNATTADFRASIETEYQKDLQWFFDEWVYKPGYPEYLVLSNPDTSNASPFRVRVQQTQSAPGVPLFRMPIDLDVISVSNDTTHLVMMNDAVQSQDFTFPSIITKNVKKIVVDPKGAILKKVTFQTLDVTKDPVKESVFTLHPSYPNPFTSNHVSASIEIPFELHRTASMQFDVFDTLGKHVHSVTNFDLAPGAHSVAIPAASLSAGSYFFSLTSGDQTVMQKLVVAK